MNRLLVSTVAAVALFAVPTFAQMGIKQSIQRQLNNAQQVHNEQQRDVDEMLDDQRPPQTDMQNVPNGWLEMKAQNDMHTRVRLYIAHPDFAHYGAQPNLPALLVLHERWGATPDIQQRADELAGKGYFAVAVDFYDGKTPADIQEARQFKTRLNDQQAMLRMHVAMNFLAEQVARKNVNSARIGAIGWCMGGEETLKLAMVEPRIKALVLFYSPLVTDATRLKSLKGPVLGIFGSDDVEVPDDTINQFETALQADKVPVEIHRFAGAGHAFANKTAAAISEYREAQAKDAWTIVDAWLAKNLAGATTSAPAAQSN